MKYTLYRKLFQTKILALDRTDILRCRPRPDHPSGLFPSSSKTEIVHEFLTVPVHATCPVELIPLDLIKLTNAVRSTN